MSSHLNAVSIEDLRLKAKRKLPRCIFDFYDGGAEDELTLNANRQSFQNVMLTPRILRGVDKVDTRVVMLGETCGLPIAMAPTGALGYGRRG